MNCVSTNKEGINKVKENIPLILKDINLFVNKDNTEEHTISKNNENWKKCKVLNSLLDTDIILTEENDSQ